MCTCVSVCVCALLRVCVCVGGGGGSLVHIPSVNTGLPPPPPSVRPVVIDGTSVALVFFCWVWGGEGLVPLHGLGNYTIVRVSEYLITVINRELYSVLLQPSWWWWWWWWWWCVCACEFVFVCVSVCAYAYLGVSVGVCVCQRMCVRACCMRARAHECVRAHVCVCGGGRLLLLCGALHTTEQHP